MRLTAIVLAMALSGCSAKPQLIPVPVACVRHEPVRMASELYALPVDADIAVQVRALLIDRDVTEIYVGELEAIVVGCR